MHRTLLAVGMVCAVLSPLTGFSQVSPPASNSQDEERRVFAAEDEYVAAEVSRDEAALRRLVDDRFVLDGNVVRQEAARAMARPPAKIS